MPAHPSRFVRHVGSAQGRSLSGPCIDRFGACVSVVVLLAAATAVFVLRQNLDHHFYRTAATAVASETTGAAIAE